MSLDFEGLWTHIHSSANFSGLSTLWRSLECTIEILCFKKRERERNNCETTVIFAITSIGFTLKEKRLREISTTLHSERQQSLTLQEFGPITQLFTVTKHILASLEAGSYLPESIM